MQHEKHASIDVDCPACGLETNAAITALIGSGSVPREPNWCAHCGYGFWTECTLDVACVGMKPVTPNAAAHGPDAPAGRGRSGGAAG